MCGQNLKLTVLAILMALTISGCGKEQQKDKAKKPTNAEIALKFAPGQQSTYKVIVQRERSVSFEGPLAKKEDFQGGKRQESSEITYTSAVKEVLENGNAIMDITVKGLKYSMTVKGETVLDFDSERTEDAGKPGLGQTLGKTYTIEMAPENKVVRVVSSSDIKKAITATGLPQKTGQIIFGDQAISERHGILTLPDAKNNNLQKGQGWSTVENFSFDMMGGKSFEKVYTLSEIKGADNNWLAIVSMKAVPTGAGAEEIHKEQEKPDISDLTDSTSDYTGELIFDFVNGTVNKYTEEFKNEWMIIDPEATKASDTEPSAVRMISKRLYNRTRMD